MGDPDLALLLHTLVKILPLPLLSNCKYVFAAVYFM